MLKMKHFVENKEVSYPSFDVRHAITDPYRGFDINDGGDVNRRKVMTSKLAHQQNWVPPSGSPRDPWNCVRICDILIFKTRIYR